MQQHAACLQPPDVACTHPGCVTRCCCRSVACGHEHTVCITTKDVFAWGSNEYGQLGHGDAAPDVCSRPFPIKVLHDVMVTQVGAGPWQWQQQQYTGWQGSQDALEPSSEAEAASAPPRQQARMQQGVAAGCGPMLLHAASSREAGGSAGDIKQLLGDATRSCQQVSSKDMGL